MIDSYLTINAQVGGIPVQLRALAGNDQEPIANQRFIGHIGSFDIDFAAFFDQLLLDVGLRQVRLLAELDLQAEFDAITVVYDGQDKTLAVSGSFQIADRPIDFFFVSSQPEAATETHYAFGLSVDPDIDFGKLPLVGSFSGVGDIAIERLGLVYTDAPAGTTFTVPQFDLEPSAQLDELAKVTVRKGADLVAEGTGLFFLARVLTDAASAGESLLLPIESTEKAVARPIPGDPVTNGGSPTKNDVAASSASGVKWLKVDKSFGPAAIEKVGLSYTTGRGGFAVSGSLAMAGFRLELDGLRITSEFSSLLSGGDAAVGFELDGLGLDIRRGSIAIAGGFLRSGSDYLGLATVKAATFNLSALGGYSAGDESFFIFARLNYPIGGPPYFFITGLAAGFGINRRLQIPKIDQLQDFPLLPQNSSLPTSLANADKAKGAVEKAGTSIADFTTPASGKNWIAAGIDFTTFEMAKSSALLTISWGVETEISLLGITRVTVPTGAPDPIAYMEVTLCARFSESSGLIAVDGRLTPASYLFSGLCRVSGGFAFYSWFDGPHEGDFVISLGGYHPRFKKPSHYPTVPRLKLGYSDGPLVLKGTSYFALTPHAFMAGISVKATFDGGSVRAWFSASLDFLLGWKPFSYQAEARIEIGASFRVNLMFTTITVTIHVGVDLSLWGPPFGGRAVVDLDIISFAIDFGKAQKKELVSWDDFKTAFLPSPRTDTPRPTNSLCSVNVSDGLVSDMQAIEPGSHFAWVLDPNHFELTSKTMIPSKNARFNEFSLKNPFRRDTTGNPNTHSGLQHHGAGTPEWPRAGYNERRHPNGITWKDDFGVMPAGIGPGGINTTLKVELKRLPSGADFTDPESYTDAVDDVALTPLTGNVPSALWGTTDGGLNGARVIDGALTGLKLAPMIRRPDKSRKADLWTMLFDNSHNVRWFWSESTVTTNDLYGATIDPQARTLSFGPETNPQTCTDYNLTVLSGAEVDARRTDLISSLQELGFDVDPNHVDVETMAEFPLDDWPQVQPVGAEIASS